MELSCFGLKGFRNWYNTNQFTQITAANKHHYVGVFQSHELCGSGECTRCSGYHPTFRNENDIAMGKIIPVMCESKKKRAAANRAERLLKTAKIPLRYKDQKLSDLTLNDAVKNAVTQYVADFPKGKPNGLYLYSASHNTGKTSVMWIIIKALLQQNKISRSFVMGSTPQLMNDLREGEFAGTGRNEALQKAMHCDVIFLDDFGSQKDTKAIQEWIFTIIDYRVSNLLPIVIGTNHDPDPFAWSTPHESAIINRLLPSTKAICFERTPE